MPELQLVMQWQNWLFILSEWKEDFIWIPLYKISFAADISRCQTVLSAFRDCAASVDPGFTAFGCQIFKKRCFFDTKRSVFPRVRMAATRLLTFETIIAGSLIRSSGSQFSHFLNRLLFDHRGNGLKHLPHNCDVLNSSTIRTTQLERFLKAATSFRVPGHRTCFLIRIGELAAMWPAPMWITAGLWPTSLAANVSMARCHSMCLERRILA